MQRHANQILDYNTLIEPDSKRCKFGSYENSRTTNLKCSLNIKNKPKESTATECHCGLSNNNIGFSFICSYEINKSKTIM